MERGTIVGALMVRGRRGAVLAERMPPAVSSRNRGSGSGTCNRADGTHPVGIEILQAGRVTRRGGMLRSTTTVLRVVGPERAT
jgi:hypothetical protein